VIARVIFTVTNSCVTDSTFDFILGGLADDVAVLNPCCGEFRLTECPTGDGDVNSDGTLTPQDALCALKIFVAGQNVPNDPDCDVNGSCEVSAADTDCGGMVTPADALAIFERFLAEGAPQPCFHQTARDAGTGAIAWGEFERTEGGEWIAAIDATATTRAAGFEIAWDAAELTFVRAERGVSAETSPALEVREVAPGRIRGGFFEPDGLVGEVVRLVFRPLGEGGDVRIASVTDVALVGEARRSMNGLGIDFAEGIRSVSPNPSRGSVTIALAVRDAAGARVRVLDVRGREVASLAPRVAGRSEVSWDGQDHVSRPVASGVYFVELTTGAAVFREKIVLVR
jgi:hypothetical protein